MPLHIRFTCGYSHRVPETAVGKKFRCKKCNAVNKVSRPQTSEESESPLESDAGSLLNQLFDDEDEIASAAYQPEQVRHRQSPDVQRTHRRHYCVEHKRPKHRNTDRFIRASHNWGRCRFRCCWRQ